MARPSATETENARDRLPKAALDRDGLRETWALAAYVRPYRRRFFVGMASLFLSASLGLLFPLLAGGLIDAAMTSGRAMVPVLGHLSLNQIALTLGVSILFQAAGSFSSALSFNRVGQSALADLRSATYARLLALPMTFFGQRRVGELASRVSTDIAQIEGALIDSLPQLCRQVVFLSGGLVLITATSLPLTAVMLGSLPLLIAVAVFFGRRLRGFSRETQDRLADSQTIVEETLQAAQLHKTRQM